jgi:hypothetical protein
VSVGHTRWCRPLCILTWFVHVVSVSSFDVVVLVDALVSGVNRCASMNGACRPLCYLAMHKLALLVHLVKVQ